MSNAAKKDRQQEREYAPETPEERAERLARIKRQVAEGSYRVRSDELACEVLGSVVDWFD
jgi:anti-sigma28 factor (negative regulator of flagellin synthesis)